MNIVCFQKIGNCAGHLALEIVHDGQRWCVVFRAFMSTLYVGNDDLLYVVDDGNFILPMLHRMSDMPLWRILVARKAACCFTLVNNLHWKEITSK